MTGTVLKQIDLAAKIGQDGSAMQAMHALGVIRDLIAGYTAEVEHVNGGKVKRYTIGRNGLPEFHDSGEYVASSDYDAIAAKLTAIEGERKLSDLGNELHNLSCSIVHENEKLAEQIGGIARELWNWPQACAALAQPSPAQAEQAEAERPEVVAVMESNGAGGKRLAQRFPIVNVFVGDELMTVAQHECIVGELRAVIAQLRQHKNDYMDSGQETYRALQNEIREREAEIARFDGLVSSRTVERDAAQAEVERLRQGMKGDYDIDAWLEWTKERDTALARVAELESKLADTQPYKQHPQIVGYARKKELAPLLDPTQPDGSHIYIGLDHPACWAEEPPYEFLTPLYTGPVAQNSVPDRYVLVPVEPLLDMMSDKDHDTRITAERQLLSILAAAPGKEVPQAWLDVQAERRRQVEAEGWTPEHDDGHACDEIAAFACYYAMPPAVRDWDASSTGYGDTLGKAVLPEGWEPKTGDRRRELVKACALALAEIERLDRAADKEQE
jgi:hypothetical protein